MEPNDPTTWTSASIEPVKSRAGGSEDWSIIPRAGAESPPAGLSSSTISSVPTSTADSDLSNLFDSTNPARGDSGHVGLDPTPDPAAQARSTPARPISTVPVAIAIAVGVPAPDAARPAAPTNPATSSQGALGAAVGLSLSDGIRPLRISLTPARVHGTSGGHVSRLAGPDFGGGGGYNGPPTLNSGNISIYEPDPNQLPGDYETFDPVPIGVVVALSVTNASPAITSYSWSGGTYAGYVGGQANQPPPVSQAAPTTPGAGASTYNFIVGPQPGQFYTITCDVTYQGGGSGHVQLTFTSTAPTGSLSVKQRGTQTYTVNNGIVTVQLNPGITLSVTAATGANTDGQFMIMQICTGTLRWYTNANGQSFYKANAYVMNGVNYNGPLLDRGETLGDQFTYVDNNIYSLSLGPNASAPTPPQTWTFNDPPAFPREATVRFLSATEEFSTSLMYKSNLRPSVWIALSEIDWSWSEQASPPFAQPDPNPTQQPQPQGPKTPSGAAAFPTWVNTTDNLAFSAWAAGKPPGA